MEPTKVQWHATHRDSGGVLKVTKLKGYMLTAVRGDNGPLAVIHPAAGGTLVAIEIDRVTVIDRDVPGPELGGFG